MKKTELKNKKYDGVSLAEIFSRSKYGTYGNLKMKPLIITNSFYANEEKNVTRKNNKQTK